MNSSKKSEDYVTVGGREIRSWRELKEELNKPNPLIFDGSRPVDKARHKLAKKLREKHSLNRLNSEYVALLEIQNVQADVDRKYPISFEDPMYSEIADKRERALYTRLYNLLSGKRKIVNINKKWDSY